jgi:D-alanyl-D-alanine carboxypeptidase
MCPIDRSGRREAHVEQRRLGLFDLAGPLLSAETAAILTSNGHPLSAISIYHLLTHTAGLRDHAGPDSPYAALCAADPARMWTPQDQLLIGMALGPPVAAPGTHFSYSDTGYVLLGEIIERVTGEALGMSVRQLVGFERLGMAQTWWEGEETAPSGQRRAVQRMGDLDVAAIHPSSDQFGGGGLVSTTGDLVTFTRALLRGAVFEHPATLAASLMTPSVTFTPPALLHSALLRGTVVAGRQCLGHKGFWGVQVADLPDLDLTLAISWGQVECGPATMGPDGQLHLADRIVARLTRKLGL